MSGAEYDPSFEGRPSKSQLKRDMNALQALGEQLAELTPEVLRQMPLEESLLDALLQVQLMPQREARRRHFQLIGKLMRKVDVEPIREAFERQQSSSLYAQQRLHLLERWRHRLLTEGDSALGEAMAVFEGLEMQPLRQLLREAAREQAQQKPPVAARKLFQYLKAHLPDQA